MTIVSNKQELIEAINDQTDFEGLRVIELAPNTVFLVDKTLWIRRRTLLKGNGSVIKFKDVKIGFKIGEDYSAYKETQPHPKYDATYSKVQDVTLVGEDLVDTPITSPQRFGAAIGIVCWAHGCRLENVRLQSFKTGIEVSATRYRNANNTSFRDIDIRYCFVGLLFSGTDTAAGLVDGLEINYCQVGIELFQTVYQTFTGVYIESTETPIKNSESSDYSAWLGCALDGAAATSEFRGGGVIVGGNLVSAARKLELRTDRIGSRDSLLSFYMDLTQNGTTHGVRVAIPAGNFQGIPSPMGFIQSHKIPPDQAANRPGNIWHGIQYDYTDDKYILGTQAWKLEPDHVAATWELA